MIQLNGKQLTDVQVYDLIASMSHQIKALEEISRAAHSVFYSGAKEDFLVLEEKLNRYKVVSLDDILGEKK